MRAAFDKLISWTGLLLAALLLVAGAMLTWAWVYIGNEVQAQLALQDITMPEGQALQSLPPADQAALQPYAGSPMDTGPEAKAYADHYILVHLNAASKGKTYSEISGQYTAMTAVQKASPEGQALAAVRDTLFQGNTLRGLLLYGAAFATMGTLARVRGDRRLCRCGGHAVPRAVGHATRPSHGTGRCRGTGRGQPYQPRHPDQPCHPDEPRYSHQPGVGPLARGPRTRSGGAAFKQPVRWAD